MRSQTSVDPCTGPARRPLALALLALLMCSACGQKGPLSLPAAAAPAASGASAPGR